MKLCRPERDAEGIAYVEGDLGLEAVETCGDVYRGARRSGPCAKCRSVEEGRKQTIMRTRFCSSVSVLKFRGTGSLSIYQGGC